MVQEYRLSIKEQASCTAVKEATNLPDDLGGEALGLEGVEQPGVVNCIECSFDIKLQEARYYAVSLYYVCSIDNQLNSEVYRAFWTITYLGFQEESLGLYYSSDSLAYYYLKDLAYYIKE